MRAPQGDEIEAIARVAARPEGQLILKYLKECMDNTHITLIASDDTMRTRALQGEARVLTTLLKAWKP